MQRACWSLPHAFPLLVGCSAASESDEVRVELTAAACRPAPTRTEGQVDGTVSRDDKCTSKSIFNDTVLTSKPDLDLDDDGDQ